MALFFVFRDIVSPPEKIVGEAGLKPGFTVLDYGCGPGSYALAAAEIVGGEGTVYALDIHPLAVEIVQRKAAKRGLANIKTILSDCHTGLDEESVDAVLLYDTFHDLEKPDEVLKELHRVLKPDGILSFSDHHLAEEEITAAITGRGLFSPSGKGKKTFTFRKTPGT